MNETFTARVSETVSEDGWSHIAILDADGMEVDSLSVPESEDFDTAGLDADLRGTGYRRVGDWNRSSLSATVVAV